MALITMDTGLQRETVYSSGKISTTVCLEMFFQNNYLDFQTEF